MRFEYKWNVGESNFQMAKALYDKGVEYRRKKHNKPTKTVENHKELSWVIESILDMRKEINSMQDELIKLQPKIKVRKHLKFRNPFYFIKG